VWRIGIEHLTAALTPNEKSAMAFMRSARTITVEMNQLSGPVSARWFDPVVGTFKNIAGSPFENTGTRDFTTPGPYEGGDEDWVLILEVD
jgi:collagenase-like protein with putative collagen-binding domain